MKKSVLILMAATALTANVAFAEVEAEAAAESVTEELEAKLEAARERLEEAAHEVAELSAEIGRPVMDRFMAFGGGARHAIIGVQLDPASGKDGAKVEEVSPGGPAAEAGIQSNDVIVMVNGTAVQGDSTREVVRLMRQVKPESKVNVRVLRGGKPQDFVVVARPTVFPLFDVPAPPPPPPPGGADTEMRFERGSLSGAHFGGRFADLQLAALTPQLGRYFGTAEGVLVVRAPAKAGLMLEDGDVILAIDGREPANGSHASRILRSYQPGEKVTLRVMRDKKALDLDVTLPERDKDAAGARVLRTE